MKAYQARRKLLFNIVLERGEVTSAVIAEVFGISICAASCMLKRAYKCRYLNRRFVSTEHHHVYTPGPDLEYKEENYPY